MNLSLLSCKVILLVGLWLAFDAYSIMSVTELSPRWQFWCHFHKWKEIMCYYCSLICWSYIAYLFWFCDCCVSLLGGTLCLKNNLFGLLTVRLSCSDEPLTYKKNPFRLSFFNEIYMSRLASELLSFRNLFMNLFYWFLPDAVNIGKFMFLSYAG